MPDNFSAFPKTYGFTLLDGGLGTTLEELFNLDISTPLWSGDTILRHPDKLLAAHRAFLEAGSHVILTATYQCAFPTFSRAGFSLEEAKSTMLTAVKIASSARDTYNSAHHNAETKVALSLGPFAACLYPTQEYTGRYPPPFGPPDQMRTCFEDTEEGKRLEECAIQHLTAFHLDRLRVFAEDQTTFDKIDCIAFETVPLAREVTAIRKAVAELEKERGRKLEKPWWISFVLPEGRSSQTHANGEAFAAQDMARAALKEVPDLPIPTAIGVNCTGPQFIIDVIEVISEVATSCDEPVGLVVYPNSGEVYHGDGKWSGEREGWQKEVLRAVDREGEKKVRWSSVLVGGCCRTGPRDTGKLRELLSAS